MGSNRTVVGEAAIEYLKKFKDLPTRAIARKLHQDCPQIFRTIENARQAIRSYRGEMGDERRYYSRNFKPLWKEETEKNIPDSDTIEYSPFIIPQKYKKGLLLADLHIPYHDKKSLLVALEEGYDKGIDFIFLNGDAQDCHHLSKFCKDPRKRHFKGEIDIFNRFLDAIDKQFKGIKVFYKMGNHEGRFEHYLMTHAPEILDIPACSIAESLRLKERNIDWIGDQRLTHFGYLTIAHGDEWGSGNTNPVNPARGVFTRASEIVVIGHYHQTSEHTQTDVRDRVITCWSVGCMCELHPEYRRLNKWNHGFAIISRTGEKGFELTNRRIINGKMV